MSEVYELPRYSCHKEVQAQALKIAAVDGNTIHPADVSYGLFRVSDAYLAKHRPQPGGYWVLYEDGYQSFSPAQAFERGYALISDSDPEPCEPPHGLNFNRPDYQLRIGDLRPAKEGGIPCDEPVFLLRAQDVNAEEVVRFWAFLAQESGADVDTVNSALAQAQAMKNWPVKKTPDLPGEA